MERYMGWRPGAGADEVRGMYGYMTTLTTDSEHGGPFVYRSADTDMLGWGVNAPPGTRMAELISTLVWQPIGAEFDAEITCDGVGSAIPTVGCRRGPSTWRGSARCCSTTGWSRTPRWSQGLADRIPHHRSGHQGGVRGVGLGTLPDRRWYRNQFWFMPGVLGDLQVCLGIHGQMVLVDRATRTVAVKFSSWPTAQNPAYLLDTVRAFVAAASTRPDCPASATTAPTSAGRSGSSRVASAATAEREALLHGYFT